VDGSVDSVVTSYSSATYYYYCIHSLDPLNSKRSIGRWDHGFGYGENPAAPVTLWDGS